MAYTLTVDELTRLSELNQLINGQLNPANAQYWQGQASDFLNHYYLAYDYLALVQTQAGTPESPKPGADASAWLWFRGAARINEGVGPFSTFIREYTKEQYYIRTGGTASTELVQEASNDIARAVIADVLGNNGLVPTLEQLGQRDAGGVVGRLYDDASDFSS